MKKYCIHRECFNKNCRLYFNEEVSDNTYEFKDSSRRECIKYL